MILKPERLSGSQELILDQPRGNRLQSAGWGRLGTVLESAHSGFQLVDSLKKENGELGCLEQRLKKSEKALEEKEIH